MTKLKKQLLNIIRPLIVLNIAYLKVQLALEGK